MLEASVLPAVGRQTAAHVVGVQPYHSAASLRSPPRQYRSMQRHASNLLNAALPSSKALKVPSPASVARSKITTRSKRLANSGLASTHTTAGLGSALLVRSSTSRT